MSRTMRSIVSAWALFGTALIVPAETFTCQPFRQPSLVVSPFVWHSLDEEAQTTFHTTSLNAIASSRRRSPRRKDDGGGSRSSSYAQEQARSKRQERVGHLVHAELGQILHRGDVKGRNVDYLDDELRRRISVVKVDVSPDLQQARVSVSVRRRNIPTASVAAAVTNKNNESTAGGGATAAAAAAATITTASDVINNGTPEMVVAPDNPVLDKRRAYSWLVRNTKPIRHSLAQRLSHMKTCPDLTFVQVDVAAAVDVMYLIDQVAAGKDKRDDILTEDDFRRPSGIIGGIDFDDLDDEDDDDWDENDDDFLQS